MVSLPLRERGLKLEDYDTSTADGQSLPLRERGLKLIRRTRVHQKTVVAPLAGAWIEILNLQFSDGRIESLPLRERGLK